METELIKSFQFNDIINNDMRKFECWGSVETKDRHGEIIPAEEVYKVMDIWMDRGAPIMYNHTNRNVGRGINWQPLEKNGKRGVLITGVIHKHYKEDDEIWHDIKKGKFEGLSIGGKSYTRESSNNGTILRDLIGYEFSVVERCGNQEATFTEVNTMAKAEDIKKEDEPTMEESPEVEQKEDEMSSRLAAFEERLGKIESLLSGENEQDEPVEENKEEEAASEEEVEKEESTEEEEVEKEEESEEEETEKEEESEDVEKKELQKSIETLQEEVKELKKSQVVKVVKTARPAVKVVKKEDNFSTLRKSVQSMAADGKVDLRTLGKEIRGIKQ